MTQNIIDPEVTIRTGVAARSDVLCLSAAIDQFDPDEPYSRVYIYSARHAQPWRFWQADYIVTSVCTWEDPARQDRLLVSVSEEGDVTIMAGPALRERIVGAGLNQPDSKGWGYISDVRQIGSRLYACGFSGQVYVRQGPDRWVHQDDGLLQSTDQRGGEISPQVIAGPDEENIYLAGCEHLPGYPARLDFWDGRAWRRVDLPPGTGRLTGIHVVDKHDVWLCGDHSTLLRGNARDGFANVGALARDALFLSVVPFNGRIYIGSNLGLYQLDPGTESPRIHRVWTKMQPEVNDANLVEVQEGVMWVIGGKDLVSFDGARWSRLAHPDIKQRMP